MTDPKEKFFNSLFEVFTEFLNTRPSGHFRDRSGNFRHMEIEIEEDPIGPAPFKCLMVRCWPNGKGDNTPPNGGD